MTGLFSHLATLKQRTRLVFTAALLAILTGGVEVCPTTHGAPPRSEAPSEEEASAANDDSAADVPVTADSDVAPDELKSHVEELIASLQSNQFSRREEASEKLFQLGYWCLPILRANRNQISDAEQSDRLDRIIHSLAKQNLDSQIESFLRGEETDLPNWEKMEQRFGDSPRIREMFIDLYREHPYLVESLDGTAQQRSIGLAMVKRELLQRGVGPRDTPQHIDLLALLLPMSEPDFRRDPQYDLIVASLLQLYPATEFQDDQVFGGPFMEMVTRWMDGSDVAIRERVLRLALQWKLDIALRLALRTLDENPDPDLICRCMQAIARQGDQQHLTLLAKYLDDPTIVYRRRYLGGLGGDVQVGDVAAAAIAFLCEVPVTEIGFAEPAEHPIFAVIYEELVIPANAPEPADADDPNSIQRPNDERAEQVEPPPDDNAAGPRFGRNDGFNQPDLLRIQAQMAEQEKRRQAARVEIHAKALELVPKAPAKPAQNS